MKLSDSIAKPQAELGFHIKRHTPDCCRLVQLFATGEALGPGRSVVPVNEDRGWG